MIKLVVDPFCHDCLEFEADIQRPDEIVFRGTDPSGEIVELVRDGDTIILCEYRKRCRKLVEYLRTKNNEKGETP